MKIKIMIFALAIISQSAIYAGIESFNVGKAELPWLKVIADARTAAMGGAGRVVGTGANSVVNNPAGLARVGKRELTLQHNTGIQDTSLEHVALALGVGSNAGLGVSVDFFNFGNIETFTRVGNGLVQGDDIQPGGYALSVAGGYKLGSGFSLGATMKLIREDLGAQPRMLGAYSLGADWRGLRDNLGLGFAVQNLGMNSSVRMPVNVSMGSEFGFAVGEAQSILLAIETNVSPAAIESASVSGGVEWRGYEAFALRGGYRQVGNGGAGGFSAGFGYTFTLFQFDYGYVIEGVLGASHQVSIGTQF